MTDIPIEGLALLDAIAVGESGGKADDDAYTILYGGGHFTGYGAFPQWAGKNNSHAAGRYQFEPATWAETAAALGLKDFSPASQDAGAWWLAQRDFKARSGDDLLVYLKSGMTLTVVATVLKGTWTSLSPVTLPNRYAAALASRRPAPAPQPAPQPPQPAPPPPVPSPSPALAAAIAELQQHRDALAAQVAKLDAAIVMLQNIATVGAST